jgi:hypothetical protein
MAEKYSVIKTTVDSTLGSADESNGSFDSRIPSIETMPLAISGGRRFFFRIRSPLRRRGHQRVFSTAAMMASAGWNDSEVTERCA